MMNQVVLSITNDFYEMTDNIKKATTKKYEFNLSVNHEESLIWRWDHVDFCYTWR